MGTTAQQRRIDEARQAIDAALRLLIAALDGGAAAAPPKAPAARAPAIDLDQLPNAALLDLRQVMTLLPVSVSHWKHGVAIGTYPAPVHLGRRVAWRVSDIRLVMAGRPPTRTRRRRAAPTN